jgi:cell surface protein SprA
VIGIGIANPAQLGAEGNPAGNVGTISLDSDVWVNEMRVSGFRNKKAWAAKSSIGVKFADVANLNLNYSRQTDGFGGLNSKLQNRSQDDRDNIGVSTSFNLHKFIPDRYGWNMPVSFSYSRSMSTPRYLPGPGDIRLSDFEDAILASSRPEAEKDSIISSTTRQAETFKEDYSINLSNFSKKYSESNWLKYTLDNSSISYVYNEGNSRSPTTVYNNNWNYSSSYNYRLSIRKVDLLQPFSWLEDVPVLDAVSGLQFGYVPSSMNYSANLDRNYNEVLERSVNTGETDFRQTKKFGFRQSFNLSYNFTPNIPINFSSSSNFNLDDVGYVEDPQDSTRFKVVPTFEALDNLISVDSISGRKANYTETYGASWRPRFNKNKWLDWLTYSISYSGGFRWANSPQGSGLGANLSNNFSLDQSGSFEMQKILGVIPYYDELKEVDKKSTAERKKLGQKMEKDRERLDRLIEQQRKDTTGENKQEDAINKIEEQIRESESQLTLGDNVVHLGRKLLLGGLSLQKIDVSYKFSEDGSQNGYSGGSNFFDMFNSSDNGSFSPNFGYRIGVNRNLTDLVANPNENQTLRINQNTNFSDNISLKTRFNPIDNLSVDLNWQIAWQQTDSRTMELAPNSSDVDSRLFSSQGNLQTNTWAFGSGYKELYERQLQRGLDDITDPNQSTISDNTGNQDGNTILDQDGLNDDLQSAYLGYNGVGFGKQNYMPIPLPNWKVTWSGLEKLIPYAADYASRVSLSHGYQGNYRVGWVLNNDAGEQTTGRVGVSGNTYAIEYEIPKYEPTQSTIQHKFVPVVGLNVTWKNNVTTSIQYDYSKITSISLSNPNVNERISQGIKFSTNWSKRGFSLPFLKKLRNTLDLSLSVSYIEDSSVNLNLVNDLSDAFINGYIPGGDVGDYPYDSDRQNSITGDSRLKVSTLIGYQFSRMIKANFEYTYDHLFPKSTKVFERVNQDIRFNIIVTIRSN